MWLASWKLLEADLAHRIRLLGVFQTLSTVPSNSSADGAVMLPVAKLYFALPPQCKTADYPKISDKLRCTTGSHADGSVIPAVSATMYSPDKTKSRE